jgi:hypothetical protein
VETTVPPFHPGLLQVIVVCRDRARLDQLRAMMSYVTLELNVWTVTLCDDERAWSVYKAEVNNDDSC